MMAELQPFNAARRCHTWVSSEGFDFQLTEPDFIIFRLEDSCCVFMHYLICKKIYKCQIQPNYKILYKQLGLTSSITRPPVYLINKQLTGVILTYALNICEVIYCLFFSSAQLRFFSSVQLRLLSLAQLSLGSLAHLSLGSLAQLSLGFLADYLQNERLHNFLIPLL